MNEISEKNDRTERREIPQPTDTAKEQNKKETEQKMISSYYLELDGIKTECRIVEEKNSFVQRYYLNIPEIGIGTKAMLGKLKNELIFETKIRAEKLLDQAFVSELKKSFSEKAKIIIKRDFPNISQKDENTLISMLMQEMLGLGKLEIILEDKNLEEIVVNSAKDQVWVYHKKFGWLKTNITIEREEEIQNFASIIARRIGKQITTLNPLLDAHLVTGDRANATLFPISSNGNTITIRRFRRDPWTVTDFIQEKTVSSEVMALVWLAIEYELNIIISGGTASGKTSLLNICMPFFQPNHRIISIEDTREIQLPEFLHWVPLTTREPNPEGKGEITMLDLLVNALRMRPDRVVVGEIRRQREAEVMFEAMHTGHSVYTTVHANTAEETIRRLTNPPIEIPISMLDAVHLNIVMFRNRRIGARRILQVAEFVPEKRSEKEEEIKPNILYRWRPNTDEMAKHAESIRLLDELGLHTGFSQQEINHELSTRKSILDWLAEKSIRDIQSIGKIMALYYHDREEIEKLMKK